MPDRRRHRGAHPRDRELFAEAQLSALRSAAADYAWLSSRSYAPDSALALVGNRHALSARQRSAVSRVVCSDAALALRQARRLEPHEVHARAVRVDGFNACITVEVALSGGPVLVGRDTAFRDLASVHGTYRRVEETPRALELLIDALAVLRPAEVIWYFDRPVSNSGTLAALSRRLLAARGLAWAVVLDPHVDRLVSAPDAVAVSADSAVLDAAEHWFDLAGHVIRAHVPGAWLVELARPRAIADRICPQC